MRNKPELSRLVEFHDLLLSFQQIERGTHNPRDMAKRENDVEHSYYLAMMVWMLAPHFNLDADKCIRIALVHDLIEIYSGDTFVYDQQAIIDSKAKREQEALAQLERDWPDLGHMAQVIKGYEHKDSEEAKFVYALDKVMPILMNVLSKGGAWAKNKITFERFKTEKDAKISPDSPIYEYYQELLNLLSESPHYFYQEKR
jgi:putative hydrolase of HD superfamily